MIDVLTSMISIADMFVVMSCLLYAHLAVMFGFWIALAIPKVSWRRIALLLAGALLPALVAVPGAWIAISVPTNTPFFLPVLTGASIATAGGSVLSWRCFGAALERRTDAP